MYKNIFIKIIFINVIWGCARAFPLMSAYCFLLFFLSADIPPSPGNIPSSHPLMVRHADHGSLTLGVAGTSSRLAQGMGRSQRTLRQLTANSGHTIHVHYPGNRQPNPPLILQR